VPQIFLFLLESAGGQGAHESLQQLLRFLRVFPWLRRALQCMGSAAPPGKSFELWKVLTS
jgi:hypothetical protein